MLLLFPTPLQPNKKQTAGSTHPFKNRNFQIYCCFLPPLPSVAAVGSGFGFSVCVIGLQDPVGFLTSQARFLLAEILVFECSVTRVLGLSFRFEGHVIRVPASGRFINTSTCRHATDRTVFPCPPFQEAKSRTGKNEGNNELEG
ncbi:hypothetical protein SLEP1_g15116 [Rubroshorea leprosula]|uniref:Uncharacterized protein n=1 Tax=Rubroshorea leprosula TaxID=152421 RepID=A0AAV5IS91_9ROSI|nr:hypothetical protein SLEP1_g15116 [Rubroshorea leprosula]